MGQCGTDRFLSRDVSYPCQHNSTNARLDTSLDQNENRQVLESSKDAVLRVGRVMDIGLKCRLKF